MHLRVAEGGSADRPRVRVHVTHDGELTPGEAASLRSGVRRMLRLDEDLAPFHALCRRIGGRWRGVAEAGLGRLLRSPTVFEDAVKTICTTNVRWGGTKAMVGRLVQSLGEPGPLSGDRPAGHPNAFPTPLRIAAADGRTLGEARLGYRAPYVRALSERIASGELDLEELHGSDASTDEVRRLLCDIKGIGPYAAATLLMLLGRYGDVAIDSVYRSFVRRRYFRNREPSSEELESVYRHWGKWKHLGYWFDLWHDTEET